MLEAIAEKVIPAVILVIIMTVFGMHMRLGTLEQVAENSLDRYKDDKARIEKHVEKQDERIKWLETQVIILNTKGDR